MSSAFVAAKRAAAELAKRTGVDRHDVAVVLGSGWMPAADRLGETTIELDAADLPGFSAPRVSGHTAKVRSVHSSGRQVLVLLGRVHAYEGHDLTAVVHAVRTAILAGCSTLVLTNAAGGIRAGMRVGQAVLISDHLNLTGGSPMSGEAPPEALGSRFVDLTDAYSARLRSIARDIDPSLEEGVYAALPGPHYETPAEIRMLRTLGADLVGMSTAHETIAARHLGAEVLGLSLVANLAAGLGNGSLHHADVLEAGGRSAQRMGDLLANVVARL